MKVINDTAMYFQADNSHNSKLHARHANFGESSLTPELYPASCTMMQLSQQERTNTRSCCCAGSCCSCTRAQ